jgi:hypothetical protein
MPTIAMRIMPIQNAMKANKKIMSLHLRSEAGVKRDFSTEHEERVRPKKTLKNLKNLKNTYHPLAPLGLSPCHSSISPSSSHRAR